ncbi:MAG TPA: Rad52/Rad22 family DNA repair protein [Candidatus Binatia bacterium]
MRSQNETKPKTNGAEINDSEASNVLDFTATLKELRKNVDPHLVRQREGWRDRNGNVQTVDYVEWHTVADILDETAPNWAHTIKDIREMGDFMVVTVAITIDGVTREGVGTGPSRNEMGIKKAEHDALKRAAVKFGIARELYKKEFDAIERGNESPEDLRPQPPASNGALNDGGNGGAKFPSNPVSQTLADMLTTKQLGMIRAVAREAGVDADEECSAVMNCQVTELSRRAASALIDHLRELQEKHSPMRRAS